MLNKLLILALAGMAGTLARYSMVGIIQKFNGDAFPWGTLAVNLTGCFLAGLLWAAFEGRWPVSAELRLIVLVGFMGAFTTFSAFVLDTYQLAKAAEWLPAALHFTMQNALGFVALVVGVSLGKLL
ncbi:CrcB family protein [bacterium]|nr:CrcB family protein [bacterium]